MTPLSGGRSGRDPKIWNTRRPPGGGVSIASVIDRKSISTCSTDPTVSISWRMDRSRRSSFQTTSTSPARMYSSAFASSGGATSVGGGVAVTVIDYVDGVRVLDLATGKSELWHRECAVEVTIIGKGLYLTQPATDADDELGGKAWAPGVVAGAQQITLREQCPGSLVEETGINGGE